MTTFSAGQKEISGYHIYAYCLMSNHIHLLEKTEQKCMDIMNIEEVKRFTDQEALNMIKRVCKINRADEIQYFDNKGRDNCLRKLKKEGLSIRQLILGHNKEKA